MFGRRVHIHTISFAIACLLLSGWAGASSAAVSGWQPMAHSTEFARSAPRIVNGVLTSDFPSTGALLLGDKVENASLGCSASLIGCRTVLTAAHCVCDFDGSLCNGILPPDPASYHVFLQHGGIYGVDSIAVHPDYSFPVADVAVLRLSTPVEGIEPAAINAFSTVPFGSSGTIVGFGRSGGFEYDYGLKRTGAVVTSPCAPLVSDETSVCWAFDDDIGPPGSDSNTCHGDSGGPLFVTLGGDPRVAGITSGGTSFSCLTGDRSYDTNVFTYTDYVAAQAAGDLGGPACGCLAAAGSTDAPVFAASGQVNQIATDGRHVLTVPAGTARLRIAMNAEEPNDFDLFVKHATPPTASSFDCRQTGSSQYGVCEFDHPAAGDWYMLVRRFSGAGRYQLTATTFAAAAESESCDDANPCTSGDACSDGTCTGAPLTGLSCDDGDACTTNGACQNGVCVSPDLVTCEDQTGQCLEEESICNPKLGCTATPKPDFTPCDTGGSVACSFPDSCQSGVCTSLADEDGDLICSFDDNCPFVRNAGQRDLDHDGLGDACDAADASLRLRSLKLIGRSLSAAADGRVAARAEFTTVLPDAFDLSRGIAMTVTDGLNLSRKFVWGRSRCTPLASRRGIRCSKNDGQTRVTIHELASTTPGAATWLVKFRGRGLPIGTPFVPPLRLTVTDGPGRVVRGTDRLTTTRNCRSTTTGMTCASAYAGPLNAFLGGTATSLVD